MTLLDSKFNELRKYVPTKYKQIKLMVLNYCHNQMPKHQLLVLKTPTVIRKTVDNGIYSTC